MSDELITDVRSLSADVETELSALAVRQTKAAGPFQQVISFAGGQIEDGLAFLPQNARKRLETAVQRALAVSYDAAHASRGSTGLLATLESKRANRILASISGAIGGLGGLPTAIAELPVATTLIFRSVQSVAEAQGEDPNNPVIRAECLRVFGTGLPGDQDDGLDTAFIGARVTLTGTAVQNIIAAVAPRFASALGQKLAAKAVPVLGALTGSAINFSFTRYYTELAEVHFALRRLALDHGEMAVLDHFHEELLKQTAPAVRRA